MGMEKMAVRRRNYRIASFPPWCLGPARMDVKTYRRLCLVASPPAPAQGFVNMTLPFHAAAPGPRAPAVRCCAERARCRPVRAPTALMMAET